MADNVIKFRSKNDLLDRNGLNKLLNSLKEKERLLRNPLLKDWFEIKNQIRKIEKTLQELKT